MRPVVLAIAALLATALGSLAGCEQAPPPQPAAVARHVRYDGATTISNRILPLVLPAFEQRTGITVAVARSGGGKGLKAMFAGEADLAGLSRALTPGERVKKPWVAIIGYDALGVWVNEANPVKALTRDQLRDLFTGRVTNWKQVGGKDLPVTACTEQLASERATLEAFRQLALDGAGFGKVKELEDPANCLQAVAADPGGVTPASTSYAVAGVRSVTVDGVAPTPPNIRNSTYPLTRPLLLVTREAPRGAVKELVDDLVSPEGQALVVQAGFVAAR